MKSVFKANTAMLLAGLCVAGLAVSAGIYFLNERAVSRLIERNAKSTALIWANQFANNLHDIEDVVAGKPPSGENARHIEDAKKDGSIKKFKLFDVTGKLVLASHEKEDADGDEEKIGDHNPKAAEVIESGQPFTEIESELENGEEELIAESYVPVVRDGKTLAAAEVYVDQTAFAENLRNEFSNTSMLVAALAFLGFAVPGGLAYRRAQQKLAADEQLRFLADHDPLTGALNRKAFEKHFGERLDTVKKRGEKMVLHYIDLDFFKDMNDQHGHAFGDALLKEVAIRLKEHCGPQDLIVRFGGDEFVVAQFGHTDTYKLGIATRRMVDGLTKQALIGGRDLKPACSIGSAIFPDHGEDTASLLQKADVAMFAAKSRGRNTHCLFDPRLESQRKSRKSLENLLRGATVAKSFEIHYQPYFDFNNNALTGFEALLRLKDLQGNYIPPMEFIPVAEDLGLIDEIGTWVLATACATAAQWPPSLQLSVNLSVVQFRRKSVVPATQAALQHSGLAANRLHLEITESLLLSNVDEVLAQLRALRSLGVAIAMDDFGSGYSSLGYMLKFPFDQIKIDRSFIREMEKGDGAALKVVQTIISLGHNLNMSVTAEGVETEPQAAALRAMHCDEVQGFLFGRPIPVTDIASLIMRHFAAGLPSDQPQQTGLVDTA